MFARAIEDYLNDHEGGNHSLKTLHWLVQREIIERNPSDRVEIIGKMDYSVFFFSAEAAAHLSNRCLLEYSTVVIDFHERTRGV